MKVYICEDDKDIIDLIKLVLTEQGHQVSGTTESKAMVPEIEKFLPDIILLDYWLSDTKADKIIDELRANDHLSDIPVILVSAIDNLEEVAKINKVDGFIAKPFDLNEIQNTISKVFSLRYAA